MNLRFLSVILSMSFIFTPVMARGRSFSAPPRVETLSHYYYESKTFYKAMLDVYSSNNESPKDFIAGYYKHISDCCEVKFSPEIEGSLVGSLNEKIYKILHVEYGEFTKYADIIIDDFYGTYRTYLYSDYLKDLWSEKLDCFRGNKNNQKAMALLLNILILMQYGIDNLKTSDYTWLGESYNYSVEEKFVECSNNFMKSLEYESYDYVRNYKVLFHEMAESIIDDFLEEGCDIINIGSYVLDLAFEMEKITK